MGQINISTDFVIYTYLCACFTLFAFNVYYIYHSKSKKRIGSIKSEYWINEISKQLHKLDNGEHIGSQLCLELVKKLSKIDELILYSHVLEQIQSESPKKYAVYRSKANLMFQELAHIYGRKESMERAYYASIIHRFPTPKANESAVLADILILYLYNSTIYCRENVLQALYVLGNVKAVVRALQIINDNGWFHHQKLISDGLATFTGDKRELASTLWINYKKWDTYLMLAIIQFIAQCSSDFCETFLSILKDPHVDLELRLAVMRYYRKHIFEPARPILFNYIEDTEQGSLSVVAAFVLGQYPSDDTVRVLIHALSSTNWYVRNNAASSLIAIKPSWDKLQTVLDGEDKYAKEILAYKLERNGNEYYINYLQKDKQEAVLA